MKMLYAGFSPSLLKERYQTGIFFFPFTLFMVGMILKEFFKVLMIFIMRLIYILSWMEYRLKKVNPYANSTHAFDRFIIDSKTIINLQVTLFMSGICIPYLNL